MTFTRIASAAAVAFAAIVSASAASAAPTIVGNFFQEQVNVGCPNAASCEVLFSEVPAGKTLNVTSIGCVAVFNNNATVVATSLNGRKASTNALVQRTVYPKAEQISNINNFRRYQVQAGVDHLLVAGEKARMFFGLSTTVATNSVICTISGKLF